MSTFVEVEPSGVRIEVARTGRAAVFTGAGTMEVRRIDVPDPAPGQVRIRLQGCGVCASNLPVWEGRPWFSYPQEPGAPGHEGWGIVDRVGEGVSSVSEGDRVAALSYHAYAEYDLADEHAVVKLPASLDGIPFPGEPLGCAMNIFRRSRVEAGQTVAIVGIGYLGAVLTMLASRAGARVIALGRRPYALELARQCGAAEQILLDDHYRIIDQVRELTGGTFCDRVIEATGKQWPLDLAGELTRERGLLVVAGYHQDGPRQVNMQLWNWRGIDVINAHERDQQVYILGIRAAVEAVETGVIDPSPLHTHTFTLEQLPEAMRLMEERPSGFVKALINLE